MPYTANNAIDGCLIAGFLCIHIYLLCISIFVIFCKICLVLLVGPRAGGPRTSGPKDYWALGLLAPSTVEPKDYWAAPIRPPLPESSLLCLTDRCPLWDLFWRLINRPIILRGIQPTADVLVKSLIVTIKPTLQMSKEYPTV